MSLSKRRCIELVLLAGLASSASITAAGAQAVPPNLGVPLSLANWSIHRGDNPRCAAVDDMGCVFTRNNLLGTDDSGDVWYRTEVTLPDGLRTVPQLAVLIQGEASIYRVFANGHDIGGSGDMNTRRGPDQARQILAFPSNIAPDGHLVLAWHIVGLPSPYRYPYLAPRLGTPEQMMIAERFDTLGYLHRYWLHYLSYLLVLAAGAFFILLFAMQRHSTEYLWLGLSLLLTSLLRVGELGMAVNTGLSVTTVFVFHVVSNPLLIVVRIEFVYAFIKRPVSWFFRLIELASVLWMAKFLLLLPFSYAAFLRLQKLTHLLNVPDNYALLIVGILPLLAIPTCWRSRDPEMKWIGVALTFLTFEELNRYLSALRLPHIPQDILASGLDVDVRAISLVVFAAIMIVSMAFRYRRVQSQNHAMEQEFEAARQVQQLLVPTSEDRADAIPQIPGLAIESVYYPAQTVGGDFFQIIPATLPTCATLPAIPIPTPNGALVVIGDVAGKGLQAAMTVSLLVGALRTLAESTSSPAVILAGLNRRLYGRGSSFTTCLALHVSGDGVVLAASAGHLQPYLNGVELALEPGLPLGVVADAEYPEMRFDLAPGSLLALLTDGVVEATSASRELFGFARTEAISMQSAQSIAAAAQAFGDGAPQADDITVLTLTRVAVPALSLNKHDLSVVD